MKKQKKPSGRLILVVGVIAVILLVRWLIPEKVNSISVDYKGGAAARAEAMGLDDSSFARMSGLTGTKVKDITAAKSRTADKISSQTGYFLLDGIRVGSKGSVTLELSAREPVAALKTSGTYVIVDENAAVLQQSAAPEGLMTVDGVKVRTTTNGAVLDDPEIAKALRVIRTVQSLGYKRFTGLMMRGNNEVMLYTTADVPVIINLNDDIKSSLEIATAMLNASLSDGRIEVAGDYGYFVPNTEETYVNKGM